MMDGRANRVMIRLVDVDQTNMPEVHAEARYTPLTERARAVTAPKLSGSEKVETCDQSFREIVIMSVDRSQESISMWRFWEMDRPCALFAMTKYCPESCHKAEQSWPNSGDLRRVSIWITDKDGQAHSVSATTGIIPSRVLSTFGSSSLRSHATILPSAPQDV